jgi:hypothetical protein
MVATGEETSKEIDYKQAAKEIIKEKKIKHTDGYIDLIKKQMDKSKGDNKGKGR